MGYDGDIYCLPSMHLLTKFSAISSMAFSLLLSGCGVVFKPSPSGCQDNSYYCPKNMGPRTAEHTIVFFAIKNPDDTEKYVPSYADIQAVTFDNHVDKKKTESITEGHFDASIADKPFSGMYGGVMFIANLLPGRYHVSALKNWPTVYQLSDKPKKIAGELVYDAEDWFFVVPSNTPKFAGDHFFCVSCTKGNGFKFEPNPNGPGEAAAIKVLLANADFLKAFGGFAPMLQQRLNKISRVVPAPLAASTPAPKPSPAQKTNKKSRK